MTPKLFEGVVRTPVRPEMARRELWRLKRRGRWVWWSGPPGQSPTVLDADDARCGTLGDLARAVLTRWGDAAAPDPFDSLPGLPAAIVRTIVGLAYMLHEPAPEPGPRWYSPPPWNPLREDEYYPDLGAG